MKRVFLEGNYLIIAEDADITDDKRNLVSNVYVEKNGTLFIFYKLSNDSIIDSIDYSDILDGDGDAYTDIDTFTDLMEVKTGKVDALDVVLQDSTAPLMIVKASKLVIETTLTAQPALNDYTIDITSAASFLVGQYLTIYNVEADRVYFSTILSINVLEITLDTPIDFSFPIGSFVSVGDTNMNVNGSVTPQIFGIRNPTGVDIPLKFDIVRLMFSCLATSAIDLSKFGNIASGLLRGIVARRVDGTFRNVFNAKSNAELKNLMYDFDIEPAQGAAQDGFTGRITFGGQGKMGAVIRIGADEDLHVLVQDDLTSLVNLTVIAEGSQVVN